VIGTEPLAEVIRVEGSRIVAVLARSLGDLALAEDALQDAAVSAVEAWARTGPPADPAAWLYVAARRKALDVLRRESERPRRERDASALAGQLAPELPPPSVVQDDQLRLLFTCCHPSLELDTRVALALRNLCGLTTAEVGRVLLVGEAAMSKRLTRATGKIAAARIPFRVPGPDELPDRVAGVAAVVHLVYTAGHEASGGDLVRADLCGEAIRLCRLLADLLPDQVAPRGLLALLLLTDARRPARADARGELVPLADQDRTRWDRAMIAEGLAVLDASLVATDGLADPYQLQAAISACHDRAPSFADTDWAEIARLSRFLAAIHPNPMVDINAAVATGFVAGPAAGLAALDGVAEAARGHAWYAARGDLLERSGQLGEARAAFARAAARAPSGPERRHLEGRAATGDATTGERQGR
jgi:RNA polymerase sigma-70 factor (ECF subfamily)